MSSTRKISATSRARRLLGAALSAAALTTVLVGGSALSASASPTSCPSGICGSVYNSSSSEGYVRVGSAQKYYTLQPGMNSTPYIKNVESIFIPSGYCGQVRYGKYAATYAPGWSDGISGTNNITVYKRTVFLGIFPSC